MKSAPDQTTIESAPGKVLDDTAITARGRIKQAIVWLALRGLVSFILAGWLIQRGGLRHE